MTTDTPAQIVLLDGGLGQEISRRARRSEPHPLWSIMVMREEPEVVVSAHRDFLAAGARVMTLNNYTATPIRLANQGMGSELESIHRQASELLDQAIEASGIAPTQISKMGCLPPLAASYVAEAAPEYGRARQAYAQLIAVQSAYVDGFLVETMSNIAEMRAARDALIDAGESVRIGLTLADDGSNQLRSGESLTQAVAVLAEEHVDAVMINCSQPEAVMPALERLATLECPFGAYANGFTTVAPLRPGGTVKDLRQRHDLDPEAYTSHVMEWIAAGATIVGGCCEISPGHIAHLHDTLLTQNVSITSFQPE
jgi:S-methylmethionine-dependent homocysteine/selenocysteine methylase